MIALHWFHVASCARYDQVRPSTWRPPATGGRYGASHDEITASRFLQAGGGRLRIAGLVVRTHGGFCWAAFTNTRRGNSKIDDDLDQLNWNMVGEVKSWHVA